MILIRINVEVNAWWARFIQTLVSRGTGKRNVMRMHNSVFFEYHALGDFNILISGMCGSVN
jgi:hypothetical protein